MIDNPATYGDFQFILLNPIEFNDAYHLVEEGMLNAFHKAKINWDLNDVPMMIQANLMSIVLIWNGDRYSGFLVLRHKYHGSPNRHWLECVIMNTERFIIEENLEVVGPISEYITMFYKAFGCVGAYFNTPRQGFIRRLEPLGWKRAQVTMLLES